MSSGPVCVMVLEGDNAVAIGRKMIDTTKLQTSCALGNMCYGSDSVESANREIVHWLKETDFNI